MKRILVFGITDNIGGIESVIMNYYRNIDKNKIQFDFLCNTKYVAYENEILSLGGKIYRITARSIDRRQFKIDLNQFFQKHANEYSAIWVNVCSLANIDYLKYAKKYGIQKRIIHSHNSKNMDSKLRIFLHFFNKNIVKKYATDFWACSENASKFFYKRSILNSHKYKLINNAIDIDKYSYKQNIRDQYKKMLVINNKIVFGHIGRFHFQKNQLFVIEIFSEILKIYPNSMLILVGCGNDEAKIKNKIKRLQIEDEVLFLGIRGDIHNLIQAMDILLFPSLFEGDPLTLIEAQTSNLLVYASDKISSKVKLNDRYYTISINKSAKAWAKIVCDNIVQIQNRTNNISTNIINNYDIKNETLKLEHYFLEV